ncbi:hypothetical protein RFI_06251 [Reticulomyxa filosa]|uniref:Uncharacterized protein n=1 Tax=Reticulomyxa filosa TaxID=46433 RepID=X6NYD9_RETFI|nr:hypothetical protein RFI_06251 [Reticulomyxa filosa]|eukprot:ETO30868.1 hypothetical protein RFI_06251 [Reticulomyxa filosa]
MDIWAVICKEFPVAESIKLPVFTLMSDSREDKPDVVCFGNATNDRVVVDAIGRSDMNENGYHVELFHQKGFAQMFNDLMNPIRYWSRTSKHNLRGNSPAPSNAGRDGMKSNIPKTISYDDSVINNYGAPVSVGFRERPYLCFETSEGLAAPNSISRAANDWIDRVQYITLTIENKASAEPSHAVWKVAKPYHIHSLFEDARKKLKISPSKDIRVWQVQDGTPYLVSIPHAFRNNAKLILEGERYALQNERLLCMSIMDEKHVQSDFVGMLFKEHTSVKDMKRQVLQHFKYNPEEYKEWVLYNITLDTQRFYHDDNTLGDNKFNCTNGEHFLLQKGVTPPQRVKNHIYMITDIRDLSSPFVNAEKAMSVLMDGMQTMYYSEKIDVLDSEADIDFDELRKKIHALDALKNNVPTPQHLLLSWYDAPFHRPYSYPCIYSGKLKEQKKWTGDKTVMLAVEVLASPLKFISEYALFFHVFLARVKPKEKQANTVANETTTTTTSDTTTTATTSTTTDDSKNNVGDVEFEYWPPDGYIRTLYDEGSEKITWRGLKAHLAQKFQIKLEHTYGAVYKMGKQKWTELEGSHDGQNEALDGDPWNLRDQKRDDEIIVVFESSERPSYFNTMEKWSAHHFLTDPN